MYNHAGTEYKCPICLGVKGIENADTLLKQTDLVYKDELVTGFINSFFILNNPGHVIIVPNEHFENLYDLPDEYANRISEVAKKIAVAIKNAYDCDGITILQNNEPAGGQHAFHYHHHIFPRYKDDNLHENMGNKQLADPDTRSKYAGNIKKALASK